MCRLLLNFMMGEIQAAKPSPIWPMLTLSRCPQRQPPLRLQSSREDSSNTTVAKQYVPMLQHRKRPLGSSLSTTIRQPRTGHNQSINQNTRPAMPMAKPTWAKNTRLLITITQPHNQWWICHTQAEARCNGVHIKRKQTHWAQEPYDQEQPLTVLPLHGLQLSLQPMLYYMLVNT